jgi:DNA-binding transcriptional LysR family regulator
MAFDIRLLGGVGVLQAVVEAGNFARAGEAVGLTASGVSRSIARLESHIGVRLFNRTPRAVTLTHEGQRFYAQASPMLAGLEEAAADAAGAAASTRGRLRVNIDPWFARTILAPRLPNFLAAHPELSLELFVRDALGDMIGEGFDIAIRFGEPEPSTLIARKLLDTPILTFAAPAYLERNGYPQKPRDLERHECLLFRDPVSGRAFPWEFRRGNKVVAVKVHGRLMLNDLAAKLAACVAGQGIAQTFAFGLDDLLTKGGLVQVLPDWAGERYPLYSYYPSRHLPPARVRAFLDFVQTTIAGPIAAT